ncbi:MAG: methionyl-tRNA formyltransferase [Myxococcaceae bacterium]|nr:methionyl-tRNA formyltransferase [Myxococcaceae bacterium]
MGTPPFAVRSLEACLGLGEVVAVVTQPDKPKGRGQELQFSAVKAFALAQHLPVLQPVKLRGTSFADELRALNADVAVVTAYGKILPKDVLEAPGHGCVNVHASLLPRFRGAAPIQWAIASGDTKTGVCLMKMDEGMDTGPVIDRAELPIGPTDTSATLHDALASLGGAVLRRALPPYLAGELAPVPQASEGVVMAPMIKKEDGAIDWTRPAVVLERRLRAFTPWPGAFTKLDGALFKVHAATVARGRGEPGTVLSAAPVGIEVACGEGSLLLTSVQLEGKRVMTAQEFLAGKKLAAGSRPFAPA